MHLRRIFSRFGFEAEPPVDGKCDLGSRCCIAVRSIESDPHFDNRPARLRCEGGRRTVLGRDGVTEVVRRKGTHRKSEGKERREAWPGQ